MMISRRGVCLLNGHLEIFTREVDTVQKKKARYALNKTKYLLPPEVERLQHILDSFGEKDARNCLLISLALRTGARAQEILNIQKTDLNSYEKSILIKGIKGSNDRELPLHSDFYKKLQNYSDSVQTNNLFPVTYNRFRQIWEHYRPVQKKLHSLRHTFAIQLFKKTKDLRLVQVALGHRNIMNTMIYADYAYSQSELRKLIL